MVEERECCVYVYACISILLLLYHLHDHERLRP